tara:strand:+ start:677 stop:1030 length:354 start_codon:yes stop_codon:yes gene_type:complete
VKKYLNIKEASKIIGLKEHVIRYWDSIDPKTNKIRMEGISTKSKAGTRYFNKDNLKKLQNLKNIIYKDGYQSSTLKLAEKIISKKYYDNSNFDTDSIKRENNQKINQILKKMRNLVE